MIEFSIGFIIGIAIMCCLHVSRENKAQDRINKAIGLIRKYQYHDEIWGNEENINYEELLNTLIEKE